MMEKIGKFKHKSRKKSKVSKNVEEFATRSTLHGVNYIFDQTVPYGDRILWLLLFLGSGSFAIFMVYSSFTSWQNNQVMTTLKTLTKPVTDLDFPAITICGSGQHMGLVEKVLYTNFKKWQDNQTINFNGNNAMEEDFALYMKDVFQVKDHGTNILDILDTMIAPSSEASGANGVRENQMACKGKDRKKRNTAGSFDIAETYFHDYFYL